MIIPARNTDPVHFGLSEKVVNDIFKVMII